MDNICSVSSASIYDDIICLLFCRKYCNKKQRIDSHPYCGRHCAGKAEEEADRQQKDLCKVSSLYPCQYMMAYMYIRCVKHDVDFRDMSSAASRVLLWPAFQLPSFYLQEYKVCVRVLSHKV